MTEENKKIKFDNFSAQYKHPLWQKKRLEALSGSGFECQNCGSKDDQLHVHHKSYVKGRNVWDYGCTSFLFCVTSATKEYTNRTRILNNFFHLILT